MTDFVDVPFDASTTTLADAAINALKAAYGPGWVPEDADPEVILVEALAPMAADGISQASRMPKAALIALGTQLLGQPYNAGQQATTTVEFTVQDAAGYQIDAGSQLDIDGYAFELVDSLLVPAGDLTAAGIVASVELTAAANGLGASVTPLAMPAFVTGMATLALTADGADPQTDDSYADELARDRRLTSRAITTNYDAELKALDNPAVARAHSETTAGRAMTVTLMDSAGNACTSAVKAAVQADISDPTRRLVNVTVTMNDPSFNTVDIAYTVQAQPGVDFANLESRIAAMLADVLSPLGWGRPRSGDPGTSASTWDNYVDVYYNLMIAQIGNVAGVRRVVSLTINGASADFAMSGAVPVPRLGTVTATVTG